MKPVAAERGNAEQVRQQQGKAGSRRNLAARQGPRGQEESGRYRCQVDALHGIRFEVVGHARGIGADHGDGGRRHPRQRHRIGVDAQAGGANPGCGPTRMKARQQIRRDGKRQRHGAQPITQGHRGDSQSGQHVIPRAPFGQGHVKQPDGQREKAQGRQVRTFAVDNQCVEPASGEESAGIEAHFLHQQTGRRNQRVAYSRRQGAGAIAAQTPRHPEQRHGTERVHGGRDEMVRETRRDAGGRHEQSAEHVQEGRIGIGIGNAAVPEREPRELPQVLCDVAREANVGGLDGTHLAGVIGVEEEQGDVGVECEQG